MRRPAVVLILTAAMLLTTVSPTLASEPSPTEKNTTTITRYDGLPEEGGQPVSSPILTEPTATGPDALTVDSKSVPVAKLPEGQSVYSDGTENGPSASSRTALTSGPRPTSSAKYGPSISPEDCQQDPEAYENSGHVIDHFDYCATSYFAATFQVCTTGWLGTSCRTTGTARWRQTVLGRGYNNPDKVTRYVDFVDVLDEWKLTGDAGTHSMAVGMSCLTQVGAGCVSSYDDLTQTIAHWAVEPSSRRAVDNLLPVRLPRHRWLRGRTDRSVRLPDEGQPHGRHLRVLRDQHLPP
jgi:hypothetical protein